MHVHTCEHVYNMHIYTLYTLTLVKGKKKQKEFLLSKDSVSQEREVSEVL